MLSRATLLGWLVVGLGGCLAGAAVPRYVFIPGWKSTEDLVARHGPPCERREPTSVEIGVICGAAAYEPVPAIPSYCSGRSGSVPSGSEWWTYRAAEDGTPTCEDPDAARQWHYLVLNGVPEYVVHDMR